MHICIVSAAYPPDDGGGIGTYTQTVARGLVELGVSVVVICKSNMNSFTMDQGVQVYRAKISYSIIEKLFPGISWSFYLYKKIKNLNKNKPFDVIEFPNWEAPGLLTQLLLNKLKTVVRVHTPYFETLELDKNGKVSFLDKIICYQEKLSCKLASSLVSSTKAHAKLICCTYNIEFSNINIIPLGVVDNFSMNELLTKLSGKTKNEKFKILYVSRLENRKGTLLLIESLKYFLNNNTNIHVDIIGKDRPHAPGNIFFKNYFLKNFKEFEDKVTFHGFVNGNELIEYYKSASLFLVPSLYESFGLIYAEAMMYGLPCIATNGGGIAEVINNNYSGYIIDEPCSKKLSNYVEDLYFNGKHLHDFSINSRNEYETKFHYLTMCKNTLDNYSSL